MFTSEQIKKLQLLYEKKFGEQISDAEALERGSKILEFVRLTLNPSYPQTADERQGFDKLKLHER